MRLDLLRKIPESATLREQWDALVLQVEQPQVFYTYEWALAVYRAYSATLCPLVFLAFNEEGSLCGVAALATEASERRVSFLCATTGDYCDFLSVPEQRCLFVSAVVGHLRKQGIDGLDLANLPADSATVAAIRQAAHQHRYFCFVRKAYVCAQVSLARLERGKDGKPVAPGQKRVRRFVKAMASEAQVRFEHSRSWDAVAPVLPQFIQAHVARFLVTGRISNMARPERRVFLSELAKLLSGTGWLAFTRMMTKERVCAWNYGFQFQGTWFWYQPTFDSDLEKYSAGFCLLAKVVEEASEDPAFKIVDLGLGAEEYKERLANQTRETLFVTLRTSVVAHYREIVRYRASAMVKSSRKVERGLRWAIRRLQEARNYFRQRRPAEVLSDVVRRLRGLLWERTEVFFYHWCGPVRPPTGDVEVRPLDFHAVASAVMEHADDKEALAYLLCSARRLRRGEAEGFVLVDRGGRPLHFAWLTRFDGCFVSELNARVEARSSDAILLLDCWTPAALRGRGYYAQALELIAEKVKAKGKQLWGFCEATNVAAVRGLAKAGFQKRYSLLRKKVLWWQTVTRQASDRGELSGKEVSAHI